MSRDKRDITERLRGEAYYNMDERHMGNLCAGGYSNLLEAAEEIERLRYQKRLLLKALRDVKTQQRRVNAEMHS